MATFHKRAWTNGQQPAINDTNLNALESDIQTFGNAVLQEAEDNIVSKFGYDQYSNSSTYALGDYCIYNNTLYVCTVAITTPEDFSAAKWSATSIKEILDGIENGVSTNATNIAAGKVKLYRLTDLLYISTGTITFNDNVDNYIALIVVTGEIGNNTIGYSIIVPWIEQVAVNGTFYGWRKSDTTQFKEASFHNGDGRVIGYLTNSTTWVISTNPTGRAIRGVYGLKIS